MCLGFLRQCLWCVWGCVRGFLGCVCGVFGVSVAVLVVCLGFLWSSSGTMFVYAYGLGMMACVVHFARMFKGV